MKKQLIGLLSAVLFSTLSFAATTDYVNVKTTNQYSPTSNELLSASLTDLSPKAVEIGLREAELLASADYDKKTNIVTLQWHSIAKTIKGTKLSENLAEPLTTRVKLSDNNQTIQPSQALIASGEVEGIIDAYNRLLTKAQESVEVDASKTLETSTENDFSNKDNGSGSGSGYLSGDGGELTDKGELPDVEVNTDQIIESVEKCSLKVDLASGLVSEQERTVKTSSNTGDVVEVTNCANSGQNYPIRRDFEAGCEVKLNNETGQYIKGFKLYAMVEGSRYNISECEWDDLNSITYTVLKDMDTCSLDKATVNADRGVYFPAFVNYTLIDGKRYSLSDCETSESVVKDLPTKFEKCENYNDFSLNISYVRERIDTYDPEFKTVLKKSSCSNTGEEFAIQRDYKVPECSYLPNYNESKLYRAYQDFYLVKSNPVYIDGCKIDSENPIEIFQETGACSPIENLTDRIAIIKKRWLYVDTETTKKVYVSECMDSNETYPIVTTQESCVPEYFSDLNKVIIKNREGWQNGTGEWTFTTACRPSGDEAEVLKEFCESPKYEHDLVGGVSYLLSRDYYVHNNEKQYLNSCSRDSSSSFSHVVTANGCAVSNNDSGKYTQYFKRRYVVINGQTISLEACAASSQIVYYVPIGDVSVFNESITADTCRYGYKAYSLAEMYSRFHTKSYGVPTYNPSSSSPARKASCKYYQSSEYVYDYQATSTLTVTEKRYQRGDGSVVNLDRSAVLR